jgi:putative Ca2+/H+ antiporter (TMEM165/GDT1 family)
MQVVTIALVAQHRDIFDVAGGTTFGVMLANVPIICLGSRVAHRRHPKAVHIVASIIFVVLGGTPTH